MAGGGDGLECLGRQEGAQEQGDATTLSTIAVQSGTTRIVIALLQNKHWVELKALEMTPELSHLAPSLDEALLLHQQHDEVLQKLASKESPVEDLLNQADQLIAGQENKAATYSAMADSLALAWRDINGQLEQRRQVLAQCVRFHRRSRNFSDIMDLADGVFGDIAIPAHPEAAQEAIRRLLDVRKGVLEASMLTLQEGNQLLEKLRLLATRGTVDSRPNHIRTSVQASCIQVERWMEELHDRRRLVDVLFTNRRLILEQCLALTVFYSDLDGLRRRAERSHRELLANCDLGDSASSAEILLYEHTKLEAEAKAVQDRGLQLLRAAEELVQRGTYAREQPRGRAYAALELCSQLTAGAERRHGLLTAAAEFFSLAQQASDRLLRLEGDLQAAPARDQGPALGRVAAALEEAAEPALRRGQQLLGEAGPGSDGTEGVSRCMDDLRRRLDSLLSRCRAHKEKQNQHTQAYNEFIRRYNLVFGWLSNVGDSFLRTHADLGRTLPPAEQFVTLHERLHGDLTTKGGEIDGILSIVPDMAGKLDRHQAKDLELKAGDLRTQWTTLQQMIEVRLDVARLYVRFHQQAEKLQASLDELTAALSGGQLGEEEMRQVEDKWMTMQQQYHQLAAVGQRFLDKTHQVRDPYLELPPARGCVEAILERLKDAHLTITEHYERVQLTTTTIKRYQRQWERCQRDVQKVEESVSCLESELYPILRESGLTVDQRNRQCQERVDSVLPMLRQAQAEVDQMAQTAQKIARKGSGTAATEAGRLARELATKKSTLENRVSEYQDTLQMMALYFKKLKDVDSSLLKRRQLDAARQLPQETEECQQALKEHDATQQAFSELFRLAGEELERTVEQVRQVEPPAAAEHDISQLRDVLDRETTKWEESHTSRKEVLEKQVTSTVFNSELNAISSQLTELHNQLSQARGRYGDSLQEAKQTKNAFKGFEDTIENTGRQIETFVSTAHEYLGSAPRPDAADQRLRELQQSWTTLQEQVADNRRLTDSAIEYFTALEEAEDWYKRGGRLLVGVARRVSQVRSPEEAHELRAEIGDFLSPGAEEQRHRLDEVTAMADRLYGSPQPARVTAAVQQSQEMVESFEAIRRQLRSLVQSLELMQQERDTLRREKDQLSAGMQAARQEAEAARSAAAAADEARRAAEAAARALENMPRPSSPLTVPKVDVCTETTTEVRKVTVDRSTQQIPMERSDAATQEAPATKVDAGTQDAPPWQEKSTRESATGQQVSPPKRHKREEEPPPVVPVFTEPLTDQTVQDGVRHTLQARVSGVPAPKVNWQKDGISCDSNPDYAIVHQQGVCTLTIEETLAEDSGVFTCRAWNAAGVAETRAKLTVREAAAEEELAPPIFTRQLTDARAREGRAIQLTATVTGNPLPVVSWLRDGACVDASHDYVITYNNGECSLRIEEALLQDQGVFVCRASNVLGTDQTSAQLRVESRTPSETPRFTTPLSNVMARAGQKLRLECAVRGLPHPQLTWLHNGRPVRDNNDTKMTFDGRRATLTIPEAFPKDAGAYTIVAKNPAGEATCSCSVSVKGRLPTETSDSEMASDMEPVKPSIPVSLRDLTVHSGQRAQLDCVITGQPEPEVIWYCGDQPVKESKDFQLLFHGDRCTLVINCALEGDAGGYSVVAINSAGEARSSCTLHVLPEEPSQKPKFVRLLNDANAVEGQRQVLEVEVTGCPEPIVIWLKDGAEVKSSESMKITRSGDMYRLEIGSALPLHAGTYVCVASNAAGEARSFSHVAVRPAGAVDTRSLTRRRPPTFGQIFKDQRAEEGDEVRFECIIDGRPQPTVEWLFDNSPLLPDQFTASSEGKRHVLHVRVTEDVPSGQVKCVAENDIGKATCAARLSVGEPLERTPSPSEGRRSSDVSKSRTSTLKKTTIMETREETQVINGDQRPKDGADRRRREESHSSVAEEPDRQVQRTTYEQSRERTARSRMVRDEDGPAGGPVRPPRFVAPLQGLVIHEDEELRLSGEYSGNPQITWFKNGVELTPNDRAVTSHDDTHVTLTLERATEDDAGKYTCCLKNAAGTSKSTAEVLVRKILAAPVFDHRLKAQVAQPGQEVVMKVQVSGIPPPNVTWTKDGRPITDEHIKIKRRESKHSLTIRNVTHEDAGKYAVCAKNDAGESTSIADFVVTDEMPDIIEKRFITTESADGQPGAGVGKETTIVTRTQSSTRTSDADESPKSPSTTVKSHSSHKRKKKDKDGKKKSKTKISKTLQEETSETVTTRAGQEEPFEKPRPQSEVEPEETGDTSPSSIRKHNKKSKKVVKEETTEVVRDIKPEYEEDGGEPGDEEEEDEATYKPSSSKSKRETRSREVVQTTKEEKMTTHLESVDLPSEDKHEKPVEQDILPATKPQPSKTGQIKEETLQKVLEIMNTQERDQSDITDTKPQSLSKDAEAPEVEKVHEPVSKTIVKRTPVMPELSASEEEEEGDKDDLGLGSQPAAEGTSDIETVSGSEHILETAAANDRVSDEPVQEPKVTDVAGDNERAAGISTVPIKSARPASDSEGGEEEEEALTTETANKVETSQEFAQEPGLADETPKEEQVKFTLVGNTLVFTTIRPEEPEQPVPELDTSAELVLKNPEPLGEESIDEPKTAEEEVREEAAEFTAVIRPPVATNEPESIADDAKPAAEPEHEAAPLERPSVSKSELPGESSPERELGDEEVESDSSKDKLLEETDHMQQSSEDTLTPERPLIPEVPKIEESEEVESEEEHEDEGESVSGESDAAGEARVGLDSEQKRPTVDVPKTEESDRPESEEEPEDEGKSVSGESDAVEDARGGLETERERPIAKASKIEESETVEPKEEPEDEKKSVSGESDTVEDARSGLESEEERPATDVPKVERSDRVDSEEEPKDEEKSVSGASDAVEDARRGGEETEQERPTAKVLKIEESERVESEEEPEHEKKSVSGESDGVEDVRGGLESSQERPIAENVAADLSEQTVDVQDDKTEEDKPSEPEENGDSGSEKPAAAEESESGDENEKSEAELEHVERQSYEQVEGESAQLEKDAAAKPSTPLSDVEDEPKPVGDDDLQSEASGKGEYSEETASESEIKEVDVDETATVQKLTQGHADDTEASQEIIIAENRIVEEAKEIKITDEMHEVHDDDAEKDRPAVTDDSVQESVKESAQDVLETSGESDAQVLDLERIPTGLGSEAEEELIPKETAKLKPKPSDDALTKDIHEPSETAETLTRAEMTTYGGEAVKSDDLEQAPKQEAPKLSEDISQSPASAAPPAQTFLPEPVLPASDSPAQEPPSEAPHAPVFAAVYRAAEGDAYQASDTPPWTQPAPAELLIHAPTEPLLYQFVRPPGTPPKPPPKPAVRPPVYSGPPGPTPVVRPPPGFPPQPPHQVRGASPHAGFRVPVVAPYAEQLQRQAQTLYGQETVSSAPTQSYISPNSQPYAPPVQPYAAPAQPYAAPAQPYAPPTPPYAAPAQPYAPPTQPYAPPAQPYAPPAQPYVSPAQPYAAPAQSYAPPAQPYAAPAQPYAPPAQPYAPPAQLYAAPAQPFATPAQPSAAPAQPQAARTLAAPHYGSAPTPAAPRFDRRPVPVPSTPRYASAPVASPRAPEHARIPGPAQQGPRYARVPSPVPRTQAPRFVKAPAPAPPVPRYAKAPAPAPQAPRYGGVPAPAPQASRYGAGVPAPVPTVPRYARMPSPAPTSPQHVGGSSQETQFSQSTVGTSWTTDNIESYSSEDVYGDEDVTRAPRRVVITYVARTGLPHHQQYPQITEDYSSKWSSQMTDSRTETTISEQRQVDAGWRDEQLSFVPKPPPPRRSVSSVGEMRRKIEAQSETSERTTDLRRAARPAPAPKQAPPPRRSQPTYVSGQQRLDQRSRSQEVQVVPPALPPEPTQRAPPRVSRRTPTPTKFVPGRFSGSDYESDYDERIPTRWQADGYEYIDRRRILVQLPDARRGHERRERAATPPSQFDRPAPVRETPPHRPPVVGLPASERRGRSEARSSLAMSKRSASAPASRFRAVAPAAPRRAATPRRASPEPRPRDASWQRRQEVSRTTSQSRQDGGQTRVWSAPQQPRTLTPAVPPKAAPVPPQPPATNEIAQTASEISRSLRRMTDQSSFKQTSQSYPAQPRPSPIKTQPVRAPRVKPAQAGFRSTESFSKTSERSGYQQSKAAPRPPALASKPSMPVSPVRSEQSQQDSSQQSMFNRHQTHESLDRPGVRGFQATSESDAQHFNREETEGFTKTETRFEKTYDVRMEKTEVKDANGHSLALPVPALPSSASPLPVVMSPVSDTASQSRQSMTQQWLQSQSGRPAGSPLLPPPSPQPVVTSPVPRVTSPVPGFQRAWQQRTSVDRSRSGSAAGRRSPLLGHDASGYASDHTGYASEPELAALAARRPWRPGPQPPPRAAVAQGRGASQASQSSRAYVGGSVRSAQPPRAPPKLGRAVSDLGSDYESRFTTRWMPAGAGRSAGSPFRPVQPPAPSGGGGGGGDRPLAIPELKNDWSSLLSGSQSALSESQRLASEGDTTTTTTTMVKEEFHSEKMIREETTTLGPLPPGVVSVAPLKSPLPARAIQPRSPLLLRAIPRPAGMPLCQASSEQSSVSSDMEEEVVSRRGLGDAVVKPDRPVPASPCPVPAAADSSAQVAPPATGSHGGVLSHLARWLKDQTLGLTKKC
ncbi:titin-like isoform X2 [Pollicipes pollicipes]|uniref:titin-like isoform X2 n=1 Tax=Pollicipes pollicipes TaxID=41117 RepID=UPI00188596C3|nr:titin-like isoform X2 [Pollicipes pollicipes]